MSNDAGSKATPTGRSNDESEAGLEMMNDAASELGVKFTAPIVPKKTAAPADGEETDEEREAREAAGVDENGDDEETRREAKGATDDSAGDETEEGDETKAEDENADEAADDDETDDEGKADEEKQETEEEKTARETQEAEDAKTDPAKKEKAEAASTIALKLKDVDPAIRKRAQAVLNEVIDRVVKKERGESDRLGNRVTELTAELETTQKQKGPTVVGSVNPAFMAENGGELDTRVEEIEKFERWARKHSNGFEGDEAKGEPSYTAEQIEARLDQVLHEKNKIIPAARANLQKRADIEKNLRIVYPAIYDPKTAEYAQVQQVLKALPELRQFADCRVIALKQILGDRALADLLRKKYEKKPGVGKDTKPDSKAPKKPVPRAPGGGSTAKGSVFTRPSGKPGAAAAVEKYTRGEGTLEDAVGSLI